MGNIDLTAAWAMLDTATRAEHVINTEHTPAGGAEVSEASADWYLVQTYPGDDARALRWLSRRRFGVFQPMQQRQMRNGQKLQGYEPTFPGWLFVFCWDIGKMRARILDCPGVMGILSDEATGRPIPVDEPLMNDDRTACRWPRLGFIERLRAMAWVYDERVPATRSHASVSGARQAKRSTRRFEPKERKELEKLKQDVKAMDIWGAEAWERVNALDPGLRIALLKVELMKHRRCWLPEGA